MADWRGCGAAFVGLLVCGCAHTPKVLPWTECFYHVTPGVVRLDARIGEKQIPVDPRFMGDDWRFNMYPDRALRLEVSGSARVHCLIDPAGPHDCQAVSESPVDVGFRFAAEKLTNHFGPIPGFAAPGEADIDVAFTIVKKPEVDGCDAPLAPTTPNR